MSKLVNAVKLNNLQYNPNRDPAVYRQTPDRPFRIQALLAGRGQVHASVEVDGEVACSQLVDTPGTFTCDVSFDTPGVRIATLSVRRGDESFKQNLRLDVLPHAWIG